MTEDELEMLARELGVGTEEARWIDDLATLTHACFDAAEGSLGTEDAHLMAGVLIGVLLASGTAMGHTDDIDDFVDQSIDAMCDPEGTLKGLLRKVQARNN